MPAPLVYDFKVAGMSTVNRAFASLERRVARFNARTKRQFVQGGGGAITRGGAATRAAAGTASEQRMHAARVAAIRKEGAARRATIAKGAAAESRAADRTHQKRIRNIQKEGASKRREIERSKRQEIAAGKRAFASVQRDRMRRRQARGALIGGAARGAAGAVGGIARLGIGALGIGGGFAFAGAIHSEVRERAAASKLANQAGRPEMKSAILTDARSVKGFTGGEALGALEAWTDVTGDVQAGTKMLGEMGRVAIATGTQIDELAGAAANAFIPLKDQIKDPTERLETLKDVIRSMAGMGAVGAVEVKQLATEMAALAAQAQKFEGGPKKAMTLAVAMAQAARQRGGASSAAEAVTSVERFTTDIVNKRNVLDEKYGVKVFNEAGDIRGQEELIVDILKATGGQTPELAGLFGMRGIRAIQGFSPLYRKAEQKKKGTGEAAVRAEFQRLLKATLSEKALKERVKSRLEDPDMQFKEAMKAFNIAIGTEMLPVLTKLIPEFVAMIPSIVEVTKMLTRLGGWVIENPFLGLAAVFATVFEAELIKAQVGSLMTKVLSNAKFGKAALNIHQAAIAATTVYLAFDQLSKLMKEAGVDPKKLTTMIPGISEKGEFHGGRMLAELTPWGAVKRFMEQYALGEAIGGHEERANEEARAKAKQEGGRKPAAQPGTGTGTRLTEEEHAAAPTLKEFRQAELAAEALDMLRANADKAGKALGAVGQPGRGNQPTGPG